MTPDAAPLSAFTLAAAVICFTPGPMTLLAAVTGARCGLRRALPVCAATAVAYGGLLAACATALRHLPGHSGGAVLLPLAGMAILLWFSQRIFRAGPFDAAGAALDVRPPGFWAGLGLNLCNPKAWAAAAALSAMVLSAGPAPSLPLGVAILAATALAAMLAWGAGGQLLARLLHTPRRQVLFNRVAGLMLGGLALSLGLG